MNYSSLIPIPQAKISNKVFYTKDVNMLFSFKSLATIAEKHLGATLDYGDICVFDNKNMTKRKALMKTRNGYIIIYSMMFDAKERVIPLSKESDQVIDLQNRKVFK